MQRILSYMRKAIEEYNMIEENDKIAICLSGGKDSITLLHAFKALQRFYPKKFELIAISINPGFEFFDTTLLQNLCDNLEIPLFIEKTHAKEIVFDIRKEKNPCSLCARMRRGAINNWAHDHHCNKVALGHHMDDVIETLLMSLFYEGRIHTFAPRSYLTRSEVTVIRPLVYVNENDIIHIGRKLNLPVIINKCPADGHTTRSDIKDLLSSLSNNNPRIKERIMSGIDKDLWQQYRLTNIQEE